MSPRGSDAGRLWVGVTALAVAGALAAVLALLARTVNRPPVITGLDAVPSVVPRTGEALLRVTAEDPDGDVLRFGFEAGSGRIAADEARPGEARYRPAAQGAASDRVVVTVTDARGLASSRSVVITIEDKPPAPTPTPEPIATTPPPPLATARPQPTRTPPRTPPPAATATRSATPTPEPEPAAHANRRPVLEGGYPMKAASRGPLLLVATGYDPDGDPITHEWETGGCFEILRQSQTEAEVMFTEDCKSGTVTLIWVDGQEAESSTRWTITR